VSSICEYHHKAVQTWLQKRRKKKRKKKKEKERRKKKKIFEQFLLVL
jgi:hypothetical protein